MSEDAPKAVLVVELSVPPRLKARLGLTVDEIHDYLEADNGDEWIDDWLDRNADHPDIERSLIESYELGKVIYEGPDSADQLPPRVHKDQIAMEIA